MIIPFFGRHFGWDVFITPTNLESQFVGLRFYGISEIAKFGIASEIYEHIFGLQIAINVTFLVESAYLQANLNKVRIFRCDVNLLKILGYLIVQISIRAKLSDEVNIFLILECVEQLNMPIGLYLFEDIELVFDERQFAKFYASLLIDDFD